MARFLTFVATPLGAPLVENLLRPGLVIGCALALIAAGSTTF